MRDYAKVSPKFWTGQTGKSLRKHPEAQIVALYLMTCPSSDMTGVFVCPLIYIAHETGLGEEGALKGLARLYEVDFCTFDEASETMFVHEMAKYQIGEELKVNDNQVKSVRKAFSAMRGVIRDRFFEKYETSFHLSDASPSEAPPKPRTRTSEGAGTEKEVGPPAAKSPKPSKKNKTPLPADFAVSERVERWAKEKGYGQLPAHLENFLSACRKSGYVYVDWDEALMDAIRKDWAKLRTVGYQSGAPPAAPSKPVLPVEQQVPALAPMQRSGRPANFDSIKQGLKARESP